MFHIRRHNSKDSWIFLAANIIYFLLPFYYTDSYVTDILFH